MADFYLLPGCGGTELFLRDPPGSKVWIDRLKVLGYTADKMHLDVNNPDAADAPPGMLNLITGDGLDDYYPDVLTELDKYMRPANRTIKMWGWDWRKDIITQGYTLGKYILATLPTQGPRRLVAHSAGGLVARFAYQWCVLAGQPNAIERIICLGTPHGGCFSTVLSLTGGYSPFSVLNAWENVATNLFGMALSGSRVAPNSRSKSVASAAATWKGFYQLIPFAQGFGADKDDFRALLYNADYYPPGIGMDQATLDEVKNTFQVALGQANTIPPGHRLVNIVGTGFKTVYYTDDKPIKTEFFYQWGYDNQGDGTVLKVQGLIPGAENYECESTHENLVMGGVMSGDIPRLLLEPIPDGTPSSTVQETDNPLKKRDGPRQWEDVPKQDPPPTLINKHGINRGKFSFTDGQFNPPKGK